MADTEGSIVDTGGIPEVEMTVEVSGMTQTPVDATLSIEGMAADAKATGDAIAGVASDVSDLATSVEDISGAIAVDDFGSLTPGQLEGKIEDALDGLEIGLPYRFKVTITETSGAFVSSTYAGQIVKTHEDSEDVRCYVEMYQSYGVVKIIGKLQDTFTWDRMLMESNIIHTQTEFNGDLNTLNSDAHIGFWRIGASCTNVPASETYRGLLVICYGGVVYQMLYGADTIYTRNKQGAQETWSSWYGYSSNKQMYSEISTYDGTGSVFPVTKAPYGSWQCSMCVRNITTGAWHLVYYSTATPAGFRVASTIVGNAPEAGDRVVLTYPISGAVT